MRCAYGLAAAIALLPASAPAVAAERPLPPAWTFTCNSPATDDYQAGITELDSHSGKYCAFLKSGLRKPQGWGYANQVISAERYRGHRLRFSSWLKTVDVRGEALVWMRVDGENHAVLAFDAMQGRRISGTTGWKRYEIVLDVPARSETINFGVALRGLGAVCFDDMHFEAVGTNVPATGKQAQGTKSLTFEN